ncbi:DUF2931 family protein [Thermomonas sp.]|uniref:DUF2931 family protein n=1 Tax=Thermomonas sp. TaxID=1971895 RepID=UPI002C4B673E|nr:DUF2931 family protein [Thermomonas sp.]HRN62878.1 DUF2931 family protein [Luteimonas sp.]HRO64349.1 DUF2931 family protein [Thermomonas sp.]HRP72546.1 DUF2931 family protein [Luteimonas sp.]
MKRWLLWLCLCLLAGCASAPTSARLPYDGWSLGFTGRPYMEVWVETADVEDVKGRLFPRAGAGVASQGYAGDPAGWPDNAAASTRRVTGADLPGRIHVRWQSLVEPQTYRVTLEVPEEARRLMLSKAESRVVPGRMDYRYMVVIGLAPGGWVKMWVRSPGSQPIEVLCQQAEVEPKGPDQGQYGGRYVTLPAKAKAYIDKNPIPYDSWKCGASP